MNNRRSTDTIMNEYLFKTYTDNQETVVKDKRSGLFLCVLPTLEQAVQTFK